MRLTIKELSFIDSNYFQGLMPLAFQANIVCIQGSKYLVLGISKIEPILVESHPVANGIVPARIVALVLHVPAHATQ